MSSIVITGASQGIGAAMAREFARTEDRPTITLMARTRTKLEEIAGEVEAAGATARVIPCDVTVREQIRDAAAEILEKGPVDLLINNAGMFEPGGVAETDIDDFRRQLDVNLVSAFMVTRAFLDSMLDRGRGTIMFVCSVAGIKGYPAGAAYCASKHGLLGLARALREETRDRGVRVTTLLPGATLTPSWAGTDLPEERFMRAEDVARAAQCAYKISSRSVAEEILIRPQKGDI